MRAPLLAILAALSWPQAGCQTRCDSSFDCPDESFCRAGRCETECFTDQDCRQPPECADNPAACVCRGTRCNSVGRCAGNCGGPGAGPSVEGPRTALPATIEGWTKRPGDGIAFVVKRLSIAPRGRGFDVDNRCRGPGDCIDNSLWRLGELGNDQVQHGVDNGQTLLLIELAGLDNDYRGDDESLTLKIYGARDADVPHFPDNNFGYVDGASDCCEFRINAQSAPGIPPQARARAPARVERGQLRSLVPVPIEFTLTVGSPPHNEVRIEEVIIAARLSADRSRLTGGILGGAIPIATLAHAENPYCRTLNALCPRLLPESSLVDLVAAYIQPDIDLDDPADGLEQLRAGASGRIAECYDGCSGCLGEPVPPMMGSPPYSCALQPQMADGFSVAFTFEAVRAKILGVGQ